MGEPSKHSFTNLLVVMTDRHIGNLLVSLYAIKAARKQLQPQQSISCVIDANLLAVASYYMPEMEFIPVNIRGATVSPWQKAKLFIKMLAKLRRLKIDTAVDLYGHGESLKIAQLSGASFISAFYSRPKLKGKYHWCDRNADLSVKHQVDFYLYPFYPLFGHLKYARLAAPKLADVSARLQSTLTELGINEKKPLVIIHPGAGKEYKLWPTGHWQALIATLEKNNKQVLLIGAGIDKPEVDAIMEDSAIAPINGFGQFNLIDTIHLGFISEMMIGNDSGPTHMMATTPTNVFSLFGPTDYKLWSPLSDNSHILRAGTECLSECSKQVCVKQPGCLEALSARQVYQNIIDQA